MSKKERQRKVVLEGVKEGRLTILEASKQLKLSYRQARRVYGRYARLGDKGLVHQSRGRQSNNRYEDEVRQAILNRYNERYEGFGPTLATEKLALEDYLISRETLRSWLIKEGLWSNRRQRTIHRQRRERRACFGELVQLDGSHHAWFGEAHAKACLLNMVDDATGRTHALIAQEETTELAMRSLWAWIERYGVPKSLYADAKNVYVTEREPTHEEELAGEEPLTAFGRACKKLGIQIITARSPQAKGRVERNHGVYQDRFIKELALEGITTIEGANAFLTARFCDELNTRFAVEASSQEDVHRPLAQGEDLSDIFCWEEARRVQQDFTVRHNNIWYQIKKGNTHLPSPGVRITIRSKLDKTIHLIHQGKALHFKRLVERPKREQKIEPQQARVYAPAPKGHPWKRGIDKKTRGTTRAMLNEQTQRYLASL